MNEEKDSYVLGLVMFEEPIMETDLGQPKFKNGNAKGALVVFYTRDEGTHFPHVHLKGSKIDSAICLDVAKYFTHGKHKDMIDGANNCKIFDKFMREKHAKGGTRWEYAVRLFNEIHENDKDFVPITGEQPDYSELSKRESVHE